MGNSFTVEVDVQNIEDIQVSDKGKIISESLSNVGEKMAYTCEVKCEKYHDALTLYVKGEEIVLVKQGYTVNVTENPQISVKATVDGQPYDGSLTAKPIKLELNISGVYSGIKELKVKIPEREDINILKDNECTIGVDNSSKIDVKGDICSKKELDSLIGKDYCKDSKGEYIKIDEKCEILVITKLNKEKSEYLKINYNNRELPIAHIYTIEDTETPGVYNGDKTTVCFNYPDSAIYDPYCIKMYYEIKNINTGEIIDGWLDAQNQSYSCEIAFDEEKVEEYEITTYSVDSIGSRTSNIKYKLTIDKKPPEVTAINLKSGDESQDIKVDEISDSYSIFKNGSATIEVVADEEDIKYETKVISPTGDVIASSDTNVINVSPNMRGYVVANVTDKVGNQKTYYSKGFVLDSVAPGSSTSDKIVIKSGEENANGFINANSIIEVDVADKPAADNCASLLTVDYEITDSQGTSESKNLKAFTSDNCTNTKLTEESGVKGKIDIDLSKYKEDEITLKVTAKDKAQNESSSSQVFKIDTVKPEISITFDDNNPINESYYRNNRTAYIAITEKNFDPSLVTVNVTKDGVAASGLIPSTENWVTDGNTHTTQIVFVEDGTYAFSVKCKDLADNESEEVSVSPFSIDGTAPIVEITYNQEPYREGYYNASLVATISVNEKNFDENQFVLKSSPQMTIGEWTHNGDIHKADIVFGIDGTYTYTIECTDKAGNKMESMEPQSFILDTVLPQITITGVKDGSSNSGEVNPVVTVQDLNMDASLIEITLINGKGQAIELEKSIEQNTESVIYKLLNVSSQEDSVYHLNVASTDIAGNKSELSYRFSLNRNGSTYDLSSVADIVDKVYNKYQDIADIKIVETNVDKIKEFNIYSTCNGKLVNGVLVTSKPKKFANKAVYYSVSSSGNEATGYTYVYTIYKENFEAEGTYNLTFTSVDKAGNRVDNTLAEKNASISFIVDDTAPMVYIDGVESGNTYKSDSLQVSAYVTDNTKLTEAEFYLVDATGKKVETWNYMELIGQDGESITLTLPENDEKQSLLFRAKDAAGNEIDTVNNIQNGAFTNFMISSKVEEKAGKVEINPEDVPLVDTVIDTVSDSLIPDYVYIIIAIIGIGIILLTLLSKKRESAE